MEGGDRYAYRTKHSSAPDQKIIAREMIVVPYLTLRGGGRFISRVYFFFPSCSLFFLLLQITSALF